MHNIELSDDRYQKLNAVAQAAGFADVSAFINALADEPTDDPRGSLSDVELKESASECDQAMAAFDAGEGRDAEQALLEIARKRGFKLHE